MKSLIYGLIAVLLLIVTFASREGSAGVTAWIGIILLVFALVAVNVRTASATRKAISTLTGPIIVLSIDRNKGSAIVPGFPAAGGTIGWMDVQVAGTQAFMRTAVSVVDGDMVTTAGARQSGLRNPGASLAHDRDCLQPARPHVWLRSVRVSRGARNGHPPAGAHRHLHTDSHHSRL